MNLQADISPNSNFFLISILIILFFEILRFGLRFIEEKNSAIKNIRQYLPVIELFTLISYMILYLPKALASSPATGIITVFIVLALMAVIIWYSFRDMVIGLILKTNAVLQKDNRVIINDIEGVVKNHTARNLVLINDDDKYIYLPYSSIINKKIIDLNIKKEATHISFEVEVNKSTSIDLHIKNLEEIIINSPWSSIDRMPEITFIKEKKDFYILKVEIFTIHKKFNNSMENFVKTNYSDIIA